MKQAEKLETAIGEISGELIERANSNRCGSADSSTIRITKVKSWYFPTLAAAMVMIAIGAGLMLHFAAPPPHEDPTDTSHSAGTGATTNTNTSTPVNLRTGVATASEIYELSGHQIHVYGIFDDRIYYAPGGTVDLPRLPLHRIRTDGSGGEKVGDFFPWDMRMEDGWLYFTEPTENTQGFTLNKMRPDGTEHTVLRSHSEPLAARIDLIQDGWIYYTGTSENLHRISTDGDNHSVVLRNFWHRFVVEDDWFYYVRSGRIMKMRTDGSDTTWFTTDESGIFAGFDLAFADGYIFFSNGDEFFRISIDCDCVSNPEVYYGRECRGERNLTKLYDMEIFPSHIEDGWIYFALPSPNDHNAVVHHRMRFDGSQIMSLGNDAAYYGLNYKGGVFGSGWVVYQEISSHEKIEHPDCVCTRSDEPLVCMTCFQGLTTISTPGEVYQVRFDGSDRQPVMFFVDGITNRADSGSDEPTSGDNHTLPTARGWSASYFRIDWHNRVDDINKIRTTKEFYDYYQNDYWGNIGSEIFERGEQSHIDEFFKDNFLILIYVFSGSGSTRHNISSLVAENGRLQIHANSHHPELGTADVAPWLIVIEACKSLAEMQTDVIWNDIDMDFSLLSPPADRLISVTISGDLRNNISTSTQIPVINFKFEGRQDSFNTGALNSYKLTLDGAELDRQEWGLWGDSYLYRRLRHGGSTTFSVPLSLYGTPQSGTYVFSGSYFGVPFESEPFEFVYEPIRQIRVPCHSGQRCGNSILTPDNLPSPHWICDDCWALMT
jgi:hypothetical protein